MALTLKDLAAKPINVELQHPVTNEPLGVYVKVVGKNSRQFKDKFYDIVGKVQAEGQDKVSQAEKMKAAEQQSAELIANCVVGWSDDEFFGGAYTPELAIEIVSTAELSWMKDQIDAAIVEEQRFFVGKPTT